MLLDVLDTTAVTYTYSPDDEQATDFTVDEVVVDNVTLFQLAPPSVETYRLDVGLVTVTYKYVPVDDNETDVKPEILEELETTDDQVK